MSNFSVIPEPPDALVRVSGATTGTDGKLLLMLPGAGNGQLLVSKEKHPVSMEDFEPVLTLLGESGALQKSNPNCLRL